MLERKEHTQKSHHKNSIMNSIKKYGKSILSFTILIVSILNIISNFKNLLSLSVLLSLVGIFAFILYLRKKKIHIPLYFLWIVAQFLIIEVTNINTHVVGNIFNLSQNFRLSFGFGLVYIPNSYRFALNIIPFIYLALYKYLEINNTLEEVRSEKIDMKANILIVFSIIIFSSITTFLLNQNSGFSYSTLKKNTKNMIELSDGNKVEILGFSTLYLDGKKSYPVFNYISNNVNKPEHDYKECKDEALTLVKYIANKEQLPDTLYMKAHGKKTGIIIKSQKRYNTIVCRKGNGWVLHSDE